MRVKIYNCIDLNNPLRDFEVEQTNLTVLELLEHSLQRLNLQNLKDNVTVFSDGQEVPCDIWAVFKLNKTKCLKFVIKPQGFFSIAMIIIALAVAVYTMVMLKKLKTNDKSQESGSSIYDPNAQGNKAKLEDPIPEQFGLVKAFPDYISDKHYFYVNNVRYLSMLLCQGVGYYDWSLNTMYIGSTPISSYVGSDIDVLVADPNTDISSHDAHRCWFNSTEVTSAGKEVPATDSNSRKRGELISETFTLNGLNLTMSSGHELVSGDIIRLYNLSGQDRAISVSAVETIQNSIRCYVSNYPQNLEKAIGWNCELAISQTDGTTTVSNTYNVSFQNYGTNTDKGKFIDVSLTAISLIDGYTVTAVLTFKNFVFNDADLNSTHVLDNGYYEIQAVNGNTFTVLAVDKNGISYSNTVGWGGFSQNRTSSGLLELVDTSRSTSNAKSNIAGYYRACPIGATSRYYEIDFNFPSGLYHMDDRGNYESRTATILLEWRIAGSADTPQSMTKVYTRSSPDAFGETITVDVGNSNNAYEFRVTNLSEYTTDSQVMQTFMWNGLKCLISEDSYYPDVTVIAITVRGSESLAELSDNQISTLWTRKLGSLKDFKTTVYEEQKVTGIDSFTYDYNDLYDTIVNNRYYPKDWDNEPDDGFYISDHMKKHGSEGYHRRTVIFENWTTKPNYNWAMYPCSVWFTNDRFKARRDRTIIEWYSYIYCTSSPQYLNKTAAEIAENPTYITSIGSISTFNLRFCFEDDSYFERDTKGRISMGIHLGFCGFWVPSDWDGGHSVIHDSGIYVLMALFAPAILDGSNYTKNRTLGDGALIGTYLFPLWHMNDDGSCTVKIDHTRGYLKVWLNDYLIFNFTADSNPWIASIWGQYVSWQQHGTYGLGGYHWQWYVGDLKIQYPTEKTVMVPVQKAAMAEDKESNRSIASPIRYICDSSKFGSIYDTSNLTLMDQIWNDAGLNFDYRFDKSTTVLEAIKQCMQIGFSEPIIDGNHIKAVYRSADKYVEQMFTSANMIGEPKITYNFVTPTDNDEADITYMNPQNWKQDEVYVDIDKATNEASVYNYQNSQNTEKVEVLAVVDSQKAIALGSRRLREVIYQRKQIDFECEFDALNCTYGSLIAVALPQDLNAFNGYIISYDSTEQIIQTSDSVPSDVSVIYVRRYNGTVQQINCSAVDAHHIQLLAPLDFELSSNVRYDKPHYAIGNVEKYWVTSIKPTEKKCSVTAVNYDARVFVDDPI